MKKQSDNKTQQIIKDLLEQFGEKYFDDDLKNYTLWLFESIINKPLLDINRGKSEIWAASIVYVIARLNFLFDKSNQYYISADDICEFFDVKKHTIGTKASQIEQVYNIGTADKRFTKPEISKLFEFNVTPEGFIIPSFMMNKKKIVIELADDEEREELLRYEEEHKRKEEEELEKKRARRAEINRKIGKIKRKNTEEKRYGNQLNLFDDFE